MKRCPACAFDFDRPDWTCPSCGHQPDRIDGVYALHPGGDVMLTVPQHPFLRSGSDDAAYHKRRYRRGELATKLRHAGFTIIRSTSFVPSLLPLLMTQRLAPGKNKNYDQSAEFAMPGWLDRLLEVAMEIYRGIMGCGFSVPVGGSRLIVAVRP